MIKLIEFLGRLVVRGYRRAAAAERYVAEKSAKGSAEAQELADKLMVHSFESTAQANKLSEKASKLEEFF